MRVVVVVVVVVVSGLGADLRMCTFMAVYTCMHYVHARIWRAGQTERQRKRLWGSADLWARGAERVCGCGCV